MENYQELSRSAARLGVATGVATVGAATLLLFIGLPAEKRFLAPLGIVCALMLPCEHVRLALLAVDQGRGEFRRFNTLRLLAACMFPLALIGAWSAGLDSLSLIVALTVAASAASLSLTLLGGERCSWKGPVSPQPRTLLKEGLPYAAALAVGDVFNRLDMLLILWLAQLKTQGFYAAAVPAANLLIVAPNALSIFSFNAGARQTDRPDWRAMLRVGGGIAALQAFSAAAFAVVLEPLMVFVYGERFHGAVPFALALLPAYAINGCSQVAEGYLRGRGKPAAGVWARVAGAAAMALAVAVLHTRWCALSVPLAASAGQAVAGGWILWAVWTDAAPSARGDEFRSRTGGGSGMSTAASRRSAITFDAVRRHPRALTLSAAMGALLLAGATFFSNAHLRPHLEGEKFSIDFEDLLRLAAFGACGLYGLAQLPRTIPFFSRSAGLWGLAFCVWTMVTIPMSASQTYALASCAALWCTFLFAPAVLLELGSRRVVLTIYGTLIFYMAASWLAYFAWPELGRSEFFLSPRDVKYRVGGLGGAQQLGLMAAWLIGFSLLLHTEGGARWRTVAAPIGLAVFTLPFTESRTSMLAAMAISLLFVWRRFSRMAVVLGGCAAVVAGSLALLMFQSGLLKLDAAGLDSSLEKVSRSGNIEEIYNLTGRTEVWDFVLGEIADSPLIGYGYGCERYVLRAIRAVPPTTSSRGTPIICGSTSRWGPA